mgnify:CR=1 FL=1
MGMESFFVTILPEDMEFSFLDGMRSVCGSSDILERDWEVILKNWSFSLSKRESYYILDNCIEMEIERNKENSAYIVLRGCFSCFDESINKMSYLINYISKLANGKITIDILGENVKWQQDILKRIIYNSYMEKNNAFNTNFGNVKLFVPPSRFYEEYKKLKNPVKRFIAKIFK